MDFHTLPLPFRENHTRQRQVESWESVTKETQESQLQQILFHCSLAKDGLTSRELAMLTGIERTSVTRVLSTYKDKFDTSGEKYDFKTKKNVTAYMVKHENSTPI